MDKRVIGNEGYEFSKVVIAMMDSSTRMSLLSGWKEIALFLETPPEITTKFSQSQILDVKITTEILQDILIDWRARKAEAATLEKLIEILRKLNMNEIAQKLSDSIGISALDNSFVGKCKRHILYYLFDLVSVTKMDKNFLEMLETDEILTADDVLSLSTIDNDMDTSHGFYMLFRDKLDKNESLYEKLLNLLHSKCAEDVELSQAKGILASILEE